MATKRVGARAAGAAGRGPASTGPFRVALTFDAEHPDRPSAPGVQERLLNLLVRLEVPSTFFIQGRWAEAYPETARRIGEDGHLIGNHSHYHARMPLLSVRGLQKDIATAQAEIIETTGVDPRPWFRCPFGAGAADERVQRQVRRAGYRHVGWHVAGGDWPAERTGADVEATIVEGALLQRDGAVVLLHTWPDRTEAAMAGAVRRLRDAGATFVRIDQLPLDELPEREVPGAAWEADLGRVPPSRA